jgi:hypothetical protein
VHLLGVIQALELVAGAAQSHLMAATLHKLDRHQPAATMAPLLDHESGPRRQPTGATITRVSFPQWPSRHETRAPILNRVATRLSGPGADRSLPAWLSTPQL